MPNYCETVLLNNLMRENSALKEKCAALQAECDKLNDIISDCIDCSIKADLTYEWTGKEWVKIDYKGNVKKVI